MPIMTMPTRVVLATLLRDPDKPMYGRYICRATGLRSGTVYPILIRFEKLGWLTSEWQDAVSRRQEGPSRKYYKLTPYGTALARAELKKAASKIDDPAMFGLDDVSEIEMTKEMPELRPGDRCVVNVTYRLEFTFHPTIYIDSPQDHAQVIAAEGVTALENAATYDVKLRARSLDIGEVGPASDPHQ